MKDAIARISRSVRQLESIKLVSPYDRSNLQSKNKIQTNSDITIKNRVNDNHEDNEGCNYNKYKRNGGASKIIYKKDRNIPPEQLNKFKPLVNNFQRKAFQNFLEPLQITNLKSLQDERPKYDNKKANFNWNNKKSNDRILSFENFLNERLVFNKMIDYLIKLTPEKFTSYDTNNGGEKLSKLLYEEELHDKQIKIPNTPQYFYHELPPMPQPLTSKKFQEYIYFLTHLKVLYKNLSSLTSGIIPEILLYTHKLTNEEYKPYRSVETYNYLIKYFGNDKNQSSFARELILVMNKDGHKPNIDTINTLLRLCRIHSNIRSIQSTYVIIIKYLQLIEKLNLEINLTTWNRIYDCIHNIFFKETFINKINNINLPICKNLSIRIISDFIKTTKNSNEIKKFIEVDLNIVNWKQDTKIVNLFIQHKILQFKLNEELGLFLTELITIQEFKINGSTIKVILESISKNENLESKIYLLLISYIKFENKIENFIDNSKIFKIIIFEICNNKENLNYNKLSKLLRFFIHDEAFKKLNLPHEVSKILPPLKNVNGELMHNKVAIQMDELSNDGNCGGSFQRTSLSNNMKSDTMTNIIPNTIPNITNTIPSTLSNPSSNPSNTLPNTLSNTITNTNSDLNTNMNTIPGTPIKDPTNINTNTNTNTNSETTHNNISRKFKYDIPEKSQISESYKIIKRLVGFIMETFEGKLIYYNETKTSNKRSKSKFKYKLLDEPLTNEEILQWREIKEELMKTGNFINLIPGEPNLKIIEKLGLIKSEINISNKVAAKYRNFQYRKIGNSTSRDRLYKLDEGIDNFTKQQMIERNIIQ